jgi:hypothetical protein
MIGVIGVAAAVGALGLGSAGLAAPKPHGPKPQPSRVDCSAGGAGLIAAITTANAAGGGTIDLGHCTYTLTAVNNSGPTGANGLPVVTSKIVIRGDHTTIAGNNTNFRIFEVDGPGGNLTLDHVTLTGGVADPTAGGPAGGGGALADFGGTVTVEHSVVTANRAGAGGGLAVATAGGPIGTMTVAHSVIGNNTSTQGGGGILNHGGNLTVTHSRVTANTGPGGGGIATGPGNPSGTGSTTLIDHSKIDHNTADSTNPTMGGGAGIANGGALTIRHSQLVDNTATAANGLVGGGLLNHATATVDHSNVKGNTAALGGGLANASFPPGTPAPQLTVKHTNVMHNTAAGGGGGILNAAFGGPLGTVTLVKSNVRANTVNNCSPVNAIAGCTG